MEDEGINSVRNIFKLDKCSPIVSYMLFILISIVTIINTNETVNKIDNYKISNINKLFTYSEIILMVVVGVIVFGLCQHNELKLAWIALFVPIIGYLVKNILIFVNIYTIKKNEMPVEEVVKEKEKETQATTITNLPVTVPSTNNVMESQKQMLNFNQAIHNNALQNLNKSDMNPPLDSLFNNNNRMVDPMPIPTNF